MMNPFEVIKPFQQSAQKQNPNLDPAATAKNMLGNPNIQTLAQALDMMLQSGKIDQATYNLFNGMV